MAKDVPVTPAVRLLRERRVAFIPHLYAWQERGGTRVAALESGVDEHQIIKTLVMETDEGSPFLVLMHGDREVSTKALARRLGVKRVAPVDPERAGRLTGYLVGGISPFGTRSRLPVYVESSILTLPRILVNGGKRGFLIEVDPAALRLVGAVPVEAAISEPA